VNRCAAILYFFFVKPFAVIPVFLLFSACNERSATNDKPSSFSQTDRTDTISATVVASPEKNENLSFSSTAVIPGYRLYRSKASGRIEALIPLGQRFRKGDLLFRINNEAAYESYRTDKRRLRLAAIEIAGKAEENDKQALAAFCEDLSPSKLLPPFPQTKERLAELEASYASVLQKEQRLRDYFVLAEADGIILAHEKSAGEIVGEGGKVLSAGSSKGYLKIAADVPFESFGIYDGGKLIGRYSKADVRNGRLYVKERLVHGKEYMLRENSASQWNEGHED
jgi:hypothetical protein